MNNRYLAALGAALLLALPLSAQAEATAAEAAWTPPVVTAEEMDAAHLGERILMRGLEGDDVRLMQQRLYDLGYLDGDVDGKRRRPCARFSGRISWKRSTARSESRPSRRFLATM